MRLLLDTHSFLWFITDDPKLSGRARESIEDPGNAILLSMASMWEMAIKASLGRLQLARPFGVLMPDQLQQNMIELMPIELHHVVQVASLPFHHRDPFDRLIVAQALIERIPIVGVDGDFDAYGIQRIW